MPVRSFLLFSLVFGDLSFFSLLSTRHVTTPLFNITGPTVAYPEFRATVAGLMISGVRSTVMQRFFFYLMKTS
jgi:hypothetical protein